MCCSSCLYGNNGIGKAETCRIGKLKHDGALLAAWWLIGKAGRLLYLATCMVAGIISCVPVDGALRAKLENVGAVLVWCIASARASYIIGKAEK